MCTLIPCQHTLCLWRCTSSLPSSALFPLPFALTTPARAAFLASPCSRSSKGVCELEQAGVTLSHVGALTALLSHHQNEHREIQETAARAGLREIY